MQKINFNDRYGLTDAVLLGRKTVTRRLEFTDDEQMWVQSLLASGCGITCNGSAVQVGYEGQPPVFEKRLHYQVGEVLAVAECYHRIAEGVDDLSRYMWRLSLDLGLSVEDLPFFAGWRNKLFVRASLMPHTVLVQSAWVERLQDIADGDLLREGLEWQHKCGCYGVQADGRFTPLGREARTAYSVLIDKISGSGTWQANPVVVCYRFRLC